MLHDYLNVMVLFLVVGLGCLLTKAKWLDKSSNSLFTKLLINVALPSTLILSINSDFSRREFLALVPDIILPVTVILSLMVLSFITAKIIRIEKKDIGLFIGLCSMSSTIFFGIPITLAVYGSHGLPYALMTYASQTVIYWTLGLYLLEKDSLEKSESKSLFRTVAKEIINMPLLAFFVGVGILLMGIPVPQVINAFLNTLSGMTSALAMLVVGAIIYLSGFQKITFTKGLIFVVIFRFVLAPAMVLLLGKLFAIDTEMIKITTLICSLPIPNTTVILAEKYKVNILFATESLSASIAIYLVFLPVILFAIHSV
ncbi:AEC family transporter [Citrobacter sp. JGM124]|uniref:AEC family transporter n=1 Tax=Citrobacter sp. JGM124 TaxID=2799789 RepID=UPI001BA865BF|nr:AEC family transporter [Citrobacter sp. JGM124]MBS0849265.1 AEC family transporter [Citrobacter sp. JGM124]